MQKRSPRHLPEKQRKIHVRSATAFLYLFLSLGSLHSPGSIYTLRSTIPIGAGLGSSASICVCLSTALLLQIRTLAGPHPDQPAEEAQIQIERISRWAFVGELCIHGDPSGVDNAVSAGGKAVIYQRKRSGPPSVLPLNKFPELPLLLVNTQQPRSTATQVGKSKRTKSKPHPHMTDSFWMELAILQPIHKGFHFICWFGYNGMSGTLNAWELWFVWITDCWFLWSLSPTSGAHPRARGYWQPFDMNSRSLRSCRSLPTRD